MPIAPPGSLLKRHPSAGITLVPSVQSRRLTDNLHDLIILAYERSTNRRSPSLTLIRSEYVSAVNLDGKYCMRLNVLVKDLGLNENVPLTVNFTVETPEAEPCLEP